MKRWLATTSSACGLLFLVAVFLSDQHNDNLLSTQITTKTRRHVVEEVQAASPLFGAPNGTITDIEGDGNSVLFPTDFRRPELASGGQKTLKVFLVFHSHTDPGWLRTFDEYFDEKVKGILDLAVQFLSAHSDARFIWSEMSFLEKWWTQANESSRSGLRRLVANGQLELSGGTWVMTDEATTHFAASIDNIVEGHSFVKATFNTFPTTSWSVDPFGHGSTMPFLLSAANVPDLVVGRLSKNVKEAMTARGALRFRWAQPWDQGSEPSLPFVNSLASTFYTTSSACGPDGQVCCQFDLGPSARSECFQRFQPGNDSTSVFANKLVHQYRQLQKFYRSNVLLVPIGDDFFFGHPLDWSENYHGYKTLLTHINNRTDLNVEMRFGTVREFFDAVREENKDMDVKAPTWRGDFFPYSEDRDGPFAFWTGFYVQRPFFKRLERIVESQLRRLDLLQVLNRFAAHVSNLRVHRRTISLCQHHDAITATSRPHVMTDYTERLFNASLSIQSMEGMLWKQRFRDDFKNDSVEVRVENGTPLFYHEGRVLIFSNSSKSHYLTIYNPRTFAVAEKVTIRVNNPRIRVQTEHGHKVVAQLLPFLSVDQWTFLPDLSELVFYVDLKPLESQKVALSLMDVQPASTVLSMVESNVQIGGPYPVNPLQSSAKSVENDGSKFNFVNGFLQNVTNKHTGRIERLNITYSRFADFGGAYVFAPMKEGMDINVTTEHAEPVYITGPLVSRVYSHVKSFDFEHSNMHQVFEVEKMAKSVGFALDLFSNVDEVSDTTIVMNVDTDIENDQEVYTDVNGMYLRKRVFDSFAPSASGSFFPAPTAAMLQGKHSRLTLLLGQSTGASSPRNGRLQVFVDRTLSGDDGKGLSYGDAAFSEPTRIRYKLRLEERYVTKALSAAATFHSQPTHNALAALLLPASMHGSVKSAENLKGVEFPCDVELISVRYLTNASFSASFRRIAFDDSVVHGQVCEPSVDLYQVLHSWAEAHNLRMWFANLATTRTYDQVTAERLQLKLTERFKIITVKFA